MGPTEAHQAQQSERRVKTIYLNIYVLYHTCECHTMSSAALLRKYCPFVARSMHALAIRAPHSSACIVLVDATGKSTV